MPEPLRRVDLPDFRRLIPALHLLRAFWIAVDLRKMVLASMALVAYSGGSWLFDQWFLDPQAVAERELSRWPWQQSLEYHLDRAEAPLAEVVGGLHDPWNTLQRIGTNWKIGLRPITDVADPLVKLLSGNATWFEMAHSTLHLFWGLVVWSLAGGAMGRMAAVQFARDQQIGIWSGLRYSVRNFGHYFCATLLPLAGLAGLWVACAGAGLLGLIPVVGSTLVGIIWGLGLVAGFLMTLILIGVSAGWPLMFATINVEGTDGFDGLSRGFNYVYERPLQYLGYAIVCVAFSSFSVFFVWLVTQLVVYLTALTMAWGLGFEAARDFMADSPPLVVPRVLMPDVATGAVKTVGPGPVLVGIWLRAAAVLVMGFVYSQFWSSTTIIYFLLRRSVDGKELDEIQFVADPERDHLQALMDNGVTPPPQPVSSEQRLAGAPVESLP